MTFKWEKNDFTLKVFLWCKIASKIKYLLPEKKYSVPHLSDIFTIIGRSTKEKISH